MSMGLGFVAGYFAASLLGKLLPSISRA